MSARAPVGWQPMSLGEVLQLEYGKPLSDEDRKPNGRFPVYGANGEKDRTDKHYWAKPSIIVGRKGSAGEVNLTESKFWPLDVTYFVTFDERRHDLRFLYHLLTLLDLPSLAKGVKPGINRNEVYEKSVSVPPLPEQQRIVGILDETFDGIAAAKANAEKNLANARALFESHLQAVFTQGNAGWKRATLGDLVNIQGGFAFKSGEYTDSGYFVMRIGNVQDGRISLDNPKYIRLADKKLERFILNDGDILVSLTGNIGRVGIVQAEHLPAVLNQRVARITVRDRRIDRDFLFRFLSSRTFRDGLQDAGHGAAQQNVSTSEIETVDICIPGIDEQRRVAEDFESFTAETQRLQSLNQQKLSALDALKKSILHQAFTGQLTSRDIDRALEHAHA